MPPGDVYDCELGRRKRPNDWLQFIAGLFSGNYSAYIYCFNTTTKNLASLRGRMSRKGRFHQGNHIVYGDFSVDLNKRECKKKHDISEFPALNPAYDTLLSYKHKH